MKKEKWFYEELDEYKNDVEYLTEAAILEFTEKIAARMKEQNVSRSDLAKRLGVSKAFVTKVLRGYANLTVRSMVSLANALACDFYPEVRYKGWRAKTVSYYESRAQALDVKSDQFTEKVPYPPNIVTITETNGEDRYASAA